MISRKFLNNDKLINEARKLYADLSVERYVGSLENQRRCIKLDRLISSAYCRYLRRLNRCVLCYHKSLEDCSRDPDEIPKKICTGLLKF